MINSEEKLESKEEVPGNNMENDKDDFNVNELLDKANLILENELNINDISNFLDFTLYKESGKNIIVFNYEGYDIGAIKYSFKGNYIYLDTISNINYNTQKNEVGVDTGLYDFMNLYLSVEKLGKLKIHGLLEYMYKYFFNYIKAEFPNIKIVKSKLNPTFLESRIYIAEKLNKDSVTNDYSIDYNNMGLTIYL